ALINAQLQWARKRPSDEYEFLILEADAAAFSGKIAQARKLYQRGAESAAQFGLLESAAMVTAEEAFTEAEMGSEAQVTNRVSAALKIARERDSLALSAIALARGGFVREAQSLIEELIGRFPVDFHVRSIWIPIAQAAIALRQGKADRAIDFLKPTAPYELGTDSIVGTAFRPIYMRGQAYLALNAGTDAAQEFKKIIDHRGVFPVSP